MHLLPASVLASEPNSETAVELVDEFICGLDDFSLLLILLEVLGTELNEDVVDARRRRDAECDGERLRLTIAIVLEGQVILSILSSDGTASTG
jgi:hypothetical protein